jgi:hypothetical protein
LSTAQFAVLGLHAAARTGAPVPSSTWKDVLDGLLVSQKEDGSWAYSHHRPEVRDTYTVGTFMGAANLVLAAHHLDRRTPLRSSRRKHVEKAIALARQAVEWDGVHDLWEARRTEGQLNLYALWSLEKACIFFDLESLDGVPWYAHVARTLVDRQRDDGGWGGGHGRVAWESRGDAGSLVNTAFALLILVRDMETQRVATPRPIHRRDVATGVGEEGAAPLPLPGAVPADVAKAAVARARSAMADPRATNYVIIERLRWLERARKEMGPPKDKSVSVDPEELLVSIDEALMDALFLWGVDPSGGPHGRRSVNEYAETVLGDADEDLLGRVRRRMTRFLKSKRSGDVAVITSPYQPVLRLLATRGDARVLAWMLKETMHSDIEGRRAEAALAALSAIPLFTELPGAVRASAARDLGTLYASAESSVAAFNGSTEQSLRPRVRWSRFRPRVLDALLHLSRDASTGEEPKTEDGAAILSVAAWRRWSRKHKDLSRPPWR